jgi:hypothetical protein
MPVTLDVAGAVTVAVEHCLGKAVDTLRAT